MATHSAYFLHRCTDWAYVSDHAYTKEDLLRMEGSILATLDFRQTTSRTGFRCR